MPRKRSPAPSPTPSPMPSPVIVPERAPLHVIHTGDCLASLHSMPSKSVHCIVTSPPYFGLRDYGVGGQIGLETTLAEHIRILVEVFEECRRVLRDDGTLWLNYGDAYASSVNGRSAKDTKASGKDDRAFRDKPIDTTKASGLKPKDLMGLPWRVAFALQDAGWYLRSDIIWKKPNPMPESTQDRPTRAHEYVFLFTKRQRYFYDAIAIATPVKPSTRNRLEQNVSEQDGSARANGGVRSERPMKAVGSLKLANARDVWDIGTEPFGAEFCTSCRTYFDGAEKSLIRKEKVGEKTIRHCPCGSTDTWLSHFATFPTELARRCIAAGSPTQCCAECAAPYKPIKTKASGGTIGRGEHDHSGDLTGGRSQAKKGQAAWDSYVPPQVVGHAPSCNCNAQSAPSIILDPFGGSGTVSVVSTSLGRRSILCELNPDYVELAENRIARGGKKKPTAKSVRECKARAIAPDLVDLMATAPSTPEAPRTVSRHAPPQRPDKQSGHGRRHAEISRVKSSVPPSVDPDGLPTIDIEEFIAADKAKERPSPTQRVRAERSTKKDKTL